MVAAAAACGGERRPIDNGQIEQEWAIRFFGLGVFFFHMSSLWCASSRMILASRIRRYIAACCSTLPRPPALLTFVLRQAA